MEVNNLNNIFRFPHGDSYQLIFLDVPSNSNGNNFDTFLLHIKQYFFLNINYTVELLYNGHLILGTEESGHCREVETGENVWTVCQNKAVVERGPLVDEVRLYKALSVW